MVPKTPCGDSHVETTGWSGNDTITWNLRRQTDGMDGHRGGNIGPTLQRICVTAAVDVRLPPTDPAQS